MNAGVTNTRQDVNVNGYLFRYSEIQHGPVGVSERLPRCSCDTHEVEARVGNPLPTGLPDSPDGDDYGAGRVVVTLVFGKRVLLDVTDRDSESIA